LPSGLAFGIACWILAQLAVLALADVSVVVAAKNEASHVEEAVRSIISQQGLSFELVFVDDGSTDDTYSKVERLLEGTHHRLVRNPSKGKVSAFNHGVSLAQGEWVCIFAGDDIMPEASLVKRWQAVKDQRSGKPVVGLCRLICISTDKRFDGTVVPKDPAKGGLTGVSYLMDRPARAMLFPVPEVLPNEDTWLETGVLHFDLEIVHSGVIGCKWRVHAGNSINMMVGFRDYNKKLTPRMAAYAMFLAKHGSELAPESRAALEGKVKLESARKSGDLIGIARSGATIKNKLRAAALSTPVLYEIRRRLYRLMSGW
jgi:glycosyltransferase involved in cell wall biosynthesis